MIVLRHLVRDVFEFFKEHFVFVVSILIVSASINIKFYYSFLYQFDVIPYVSVQEILASSFLSLGELNLPIVVAILFLVAIVEISISTNSTSLPPSTNRIRAKKLILNSLILIPVYEVLEFGIYLVYPSYIQHFNNLSIGLEEAGYIIGVLSMLILLIFYWLDFHSILISSPKVTYVIVILSVISIGTFSNSIKAGLKSKYFKSYIGTKVIVENDTIISTPQLMYIGQTNGYIFHFDFDKNKTDVIPMSQVKKIEIVAQVEEKVTGSKKITELKTPNSKKYNEKMELDTANVNKPAKHSR